ncbi:MAG: hypothetical protein KF884_05560 [Fimbriimonadaceae bacterium]|nr:hypothetical protein [Fimbriimonadaceae bacterium]QYK59552.1 MAG: hypothetical protein KF884_05560 [Fimbriimonadaceae bacterium]
MTGLFLAIWSICLAEPQQRVRDDLVLVVASDRPFDEMPRLDASAAHWDDDALASKGLLAIERNERLTLIAPAGLLRRTVFERDLTLLKGLSQARLSQGLGEIDALSPETRELLQKRIAEVNSVKDVDVSGARFALLPEVSISLEHEGKVVEISVSPSNNNDIKSSLVASPVKGVDHGGFWVGTRTPEQLVAMQAEEARAAKENAKALEQQAERAWRVPSLAFKVVARGWVPDQERLALIKQSADLVEAWHRNQVAERARSVTQLLANLKLGEDEALNGIAGMTGDKSQLPDSVQKLVREQLEADARRYGLGTPEKLERFWTGAKLASVRKKVYLAVSTGSAHGVGMITEVQIASAPSP